MAKHGTATDGADLGHLLHLKLQNTEKQEMREMQLLQFLLWPAGGGQIHQHEHLKVGGAFISSYTFSNKCKNIHE